MDHYIVKESPAEIKLYLAQRTQRNVVSYIIGIILYDILLQWVPSILGLVFPLTYKDFLASQSQSFAEGAAQAWNGLPSVTFVATIYGLLVAGALLLGRCIFTMNFIKKVKSDYNDLFGGFGFYFKAFSLYLLQALIVFAWTLLFVIPGIIAFYNYRQAFYLLADDPSKKVTQCLRESHFLMTGNRMNLFRLDISYLLMIIIFSIPQMVVSSFVKSSTAGGTIALLICDAITYIAMASAYLGQCQFFLLIKKGTIEIQQNMSENGGMMD